MTAAAGTIIWMNARVVSCEDGHGNSYGLLPGLWAIVMKAGVIAQLVPMERFASVAGESCIDLHGQLVTPGFIDCHTHLVFAGDRSSEWEMRLQGRSYSEIAEAGGGILSTVRATRVCSEDELFALALPRLRAIAQEGVTRVEIKSGYGLTLEDELKILRVIRRLREADIADISATLLAAHTVPPEFKGESEAYVRLICEELIPRVADEGLADAVDVFCEPIAFSLAQSEQIFAAASKHNLAVKAHAEQLSHTGCAKAAARYGALSVDHLEYLGSGDLGEIRAAGTVAVLLPGAFYALREKQAPPVQALRAAGIPLAVATDCNPGTSPFTSIRMMMNLACVLFSLTPAEALQGVTRNAAKALGRERAIGTIAVGQEATLCAWAVREPAAIVTDLSRPVLTHVVRRGVTRHV